jgi:hypothetical protein
MSKIQQVGFMIANLKKCKFALPERKISGLLLGVPDIAQEKN